jgi:preprotein translocase subunit SecF
MESQHDDIGELIREKIDASDQKLDDAVWGEIQKTLQKEKRRRAFYTWSLNSVIVLFSVIGIYFLVTSFNNSENKINKGSHSVISTANDVDKTGNSDLITRETETLENRTQLEAEYLTEVLNQELDAPALSNKKANNQKSAKITSEKEKKEAMQNQPAKETIQSYEATNSVVKTGSSEVEDKVAIRTEKVYYYYNSKDGQEVMTTDKKVIDSVMQSNAKKKDSIR